MEHVDVVVVGSGSAGSPLAARLSEDERCRVLLLEAGPDLTEPDPQRYLALSPHTVTFPTPELDWGYVSEPLPSGGTSPILRGRLVGGSSMVNGCMWVRGRPSDFDRWVDLGAEGWDRARMSELYDRVQARVPSTTYPRETWSALQRTFADGCLELGYRWVDDVNAEDAWAESGQDGVVGAWPHNIVDEVRQGSATTYLADARGRTNLEVRARCLVDRVEVSGDRVTGVSYLDAAGDRDTVGADLVVISAGGYGTPAILQRSGIGPAAELERIGIPVLADLPVGIDVADHVYLALPVSSTDRSLERSAPPSAAAARSSDWFAYEVPAGEPGLSLIGFGLATHSVPRGRVRIRSRDPRAAPLIDLALGQLIGSNAFDAPWESYRRLLGTPAYRAVEAVDPAGDSPLSERIPTSIMSGFHPAGGCAIGRVVDPGLTVSGFSNLMVADASVFPANVSNNPNLTCFAIGEGASDIIRRRA